jgi:hypothetical protein
VIFFHAVFQAVLTVAPHACNAGDNTLEYDRLTGWTRAWLLLAGLGGLFALLFRLFGFGIKLAGLVTVLGAFVCECCSMI